MNRLWGDRAARAVTLEKMEPCGLRRYAGIGFKRRCASTPVLGAASLILREGESNMGNRTAHAVTLEKMEPCGLRRYAGIGFKRRCASTPVLGAARLSLREDESIMGGPCGLRRYAREDAVSRKQKHPRPYRSRVFKVGLTGIEPAHLAVLDPKSSASASSATAPHV